MFTNKDFRQPIYQLYFCHKDHCRNSLGDVGQSYQRHVKRRPIKFPYLMRTGRSHKERTGFRAEPTVIQPTVTSAALSLLKT